MIKHTVNINLPDEPEDSGGVNITPTAPRNVIGQSKESGEALLILWDAPETGKAFSYNILLDDVVIANTSARSYYYTPVVGDETYQFKIQSVGIFQKLGGISDIFNWTGGQLSLMYPTLYPNWRKATLYWDPVESTPDYTIEGYNVWLHNGVSFQKHNEELLPLSTLNYTFEDLPFNSFIQVGVSYEYNTVEESDIYSKSDITAKSPEGNWLVKIKTRHASSLVRSSTTYKGISKSDSFSNMAIHIRANASPVKIFPEIAESFDYRISRASLYFNYIFYLMNPETNRSTYFIGPDCVAPELTSSNLHPIEEILPKHSSIGGGFTRSGGFVFIIGGCETGNDEVGIYFEVSIPPEDFMGATLPKDNDLTSIELNADPPINFAVDENYLATWDDFPELLGYNIYVTDVLDDDYQKYNTELITTNSFDLSTLPPAEYNAFLTAVFESSSPTGFFETLYVAEQRTVNFEVTV